MMMDNAKIPAALTVALAFSMGCTIIIKPPDSNNGPPIAIPLTCNPTSVAPTAHMIFLARVEKSTVNLAEHYAQFMTSTGLMLAGAGLNPTTAVLLRADERPVETAFMGAWGCTTDSPDTLAPSEVFRYYAVNDPLEDGPLGCMTDTVLSEGAALGDVVSRYPSELPGTNSVRVFGGVPDVVIVVHLDALARRTGATDVECQSASELAKVGADNSAVWLNYVDGSVPMNRIVHWFVASEEGMDRTTFVQRCRSFEAFPTNVLDVIEPSPRHLYGPLTSQINSAGGHATFMPVCDMLGADARFFKEQAALIGGLVGLDVDENKVIETIMNGPNPNPGPDGTELDTTLRPPG